MLAGLIPATQPFYSDADLVEEPAVVGTFAPLRAVSKSGAAEPAHESVTIRRTAPRLPKDMTRFYPGYPRGAKHLALGVRWAEGELHLIVLDRERLRHATVKAGLVAEKIDEVLILDVPTTRLRSFMEHAASDAYQESKTLCRQ